MTLVKTTCIILITLFLLPGILSLAFRKIPNGFQPSLDDSQHLSKSISISQSFIANADNLSGAALTIRNPVLLNKKDLIVNIYSEDKAVNQQVTLNGKTIPDGGFIHIDFQPISDSKQKQFTLTFVAPSSEDNEALALYHSNQSLSGYGAYRVNNELKKGNLAFVTYYSIRNPLQAMVMTYGLWLQKLVSDLAFFIFYLGSILGLIILLFYKKLN